MGLTWLGKKVFTENERLVYHGKFSLDVAWMFMNGEILERQVQGLRVLKEFEKSKDGKDILLDWIKDKDVFSTINRGGGHVQII